MADNQVVDLNAAYASYLAAVGAANPLAQANAELPADAAMFLELGAAARERAEIALQHGLVHCDPCILRSADEIRLLPPVPRPPKVICVGLNYRDHAEEMNLPIPEYPALFSKYTSTLIGAGDPICLPRVSDRVDYEAELAIVIGKRGRYVSGADALEYVAGYTLLNDVSMRDYQMRTSQWVSGKIFHKSTPVGPALVTADEIADSGSLDIELILNGEVLQRSNTREFIFNVPAIVAYLSEICELEPGDIIATGTPPGVGTSRKPPVFLKPGDTVTVRVSGIGELTNPVTAEPR